MSAQLNGAQAVGGSGIPLCQSGPASTNTTLTVRAAPSNYDAVYLGFNSNVTANSGQPTDGVPIYPGESITYDESALGGQSLASVFVIAGGNTQSGYNQNVQWTLGGMLSAPPSAFSQMLPMLSSGFYSGNFISPVYSTPWAKGICIYDNVFNMSTSGATHQVFLQGVDSWGNLTNQAAGELLRGTLLSGTGTARTYVYYAYPGSPNSTGANGTDVAQNVPLPTNWRIQVTQALGGGSGFGYSLSASLVP